MLLSAHDVTLGRMVHRRNGRHAARCSEMRGRNTSHAPPLARELETPAKPARIHRGPMYVDPLDPLDDARRIHFQSSTGTGTGKEKMRDETNSMSWRTWSCVDGQQGRLLSSVFCTCGPALSALLSPPPSASPACFCFDIQGPGTEPRRTENGGRRKKHEKRLSSMLRCHYLWSCRSHQASKLESKMMGLLNRPMTSMTVFDRASR
jgi:hypothetical protein